MESSRKKKSSLLKTVSLVALIAVPAFVLGSVLDFVRIKSEDNDCVVVVRETGARVSRVVRSDFNGKGKVIAMELDSDKAFLVTPEGKPDRLLTVLPGKKAYVWVKKEKGEMLVALKLTSTLPVDDEYKAVEKHFTVAWPWPRPKTVVSGDENKHSNTDILRIRRGRDEVRFMVSGP